MRKDLPVFYRCSSCPGYCCTYPQIEVTPRDMARLAQRFGITAKQAEQRFTKAGDEPDTRIMRHKKDHIFETSCRFLDPVKRNCTVYEHRPQVCRDFPGGGRCGYYDFLAFERRSQADDEVVVTARAVWR